MADWLNAAGRANGTAIKGCHEGREGRRIHMWLKNCSRTLICVNGQCFDNAASAGRYVLELSSQGETVTVTRQLDLSRCLSGDGEKG